MNSRELLDLAARFHGHLGPWLALGLRAGLHARRAVSADPFCLTAVVRCPGRTPYTCFLDGVQFGSGCTLGKGNIRHLRAARHLVAEFRRRDGNGPALRLELRPEVWTELHLAPARTEPAVVRLGRAFYRRPLARLFIETHR
ncbi:MAG: formylmethanofuran dehydrogenase subunit E family protein [bacterium]